MIDFHNHVLPNVDDGPKIIEESLLMLRHASYQGITDIVQTVHFQHPKMNKKNVDYNYLNAKVRELQLEIDKENLGITIHLSAEVFYLPNLIEISNNPLVTIGYGKYMLVEFSSNIFPIGYEEEFFKLQMEGITPIIAHPERYRFIKNDLNILKKWIDRGYVIQMDAGSILGQFGQEIKKIASKMINNGLVHLIGSDSHNSKKRNFCIKDAYDSLESKILIELLKANAKRILEGQKIENYDNKKTNNFIDKVYHKIRNLIDKT